MQVRDVGVLVILEGAQPDDLRLGLEGQNHGDQGLEGRHGMPAYTASKFGVRGLAKTAAIELRYLEIGGNARLLRPRRWSVYFIIEAKK